MICLGIGNASNGRTAALLVANAETIQAFIDQQENGFLLLQGQP